MIAVTLFMELFLAVASGATPDARKSVRTKVLTEPIE